MKNAMRVGAIVVDLDRTLLRTDKTLSPYTLDVLNKCREKGMKIMVATARPLRTAARYCEMIGADAMAVSNGARVICGARRTEYGISRTSAVELLNRLNSRPSLLVTLETGDVAYSNRPVEEYETVVTGDLAAVAEAEGAVKILVSLDSEETLGFVRDALTEDLYHTVAGGHLIQIMHRAATKWNGIRAMLDICGCVPEETAYFGDDHDDVEPLRMCGMGVAVSNAIDEAKAAAGHIAGSNDADGVARFIEERLLVRS